MKFSEIFAKRDRILQNLMKEFGISLQELKDVLLSYSDGIRISWLIPEKFGLSRDVENWFIFSPSFLRYALRNKFHNHFDAGREIEIMGCRYLSSIGLSVVVLNYRSRNGEVDIICSDGESMRFVEVKGVVRGRTFTPEERINGEKVNKILRVSEDFSEEVGCRDFRYDGLFFDGVRFSYYRDYLI